MASASTSVRLVLASASPRRRELLAELGVPFEVRPGSVDETPPPGLDADAVATLLALRKARACPAAPGDVVLGADTVVEAEDGELLGKPEDAADAARMLAKLSGTAHRVITGFALVRAAPPLERVVCVSTTITMRPLTSQEIEAYVASGESAGKAGAYAIQETGDRFVTQVAGSWSNVVGLPLERLRGCLEDIGMLPR